MHVLGSGTLSNSSAQSATSGESARHSGLSTLGLYFRLLPRAVEWSDGAVGIVAVGEIQRIVRGIRTGRIEDIVVALVLLREVLLSKGGSDNKKQGNQNQAGLPPMSRCRS